jgi:hypothetical protein
VTSPASSALARWTCRVPPFRSAHSGPAAAEAGLDGCTVAWLRWGKPPMRRETGGPPTGHRSTPVANPTEPFLIGDPGRPSHLTWMATACRFGAVGVGSSD